MTEAQIYEFINVHQGNLISLMQWWASISFALVALAYFGRNSLHLVLVCIVLLLYVAFSLFAYGVFIDQINRIVLLSDDFVAIAESAPEVSGISMYFIERAREGNSGSWLQYLELLIAIFGTFLASISYVIFAYRMNRKRRAD